MPGTLKPPFIVIQDAPEQIVLRSGDDPYSSIGSRLRMVASLLPMSLRAMVIAFVFGAVILLLYALLSPVVRALIDASGIATTYPKSDVFEALREGQPIMAVVLIMGLGLALHLPVQVLRGEFIPHVEWLTFPRGERRMILSRSKKHPLPKSDYAIECFVPDATSLRLRVRALNQKPMTVRYEVSDPAIILRLRDFCGLADCGDA